MTPGLLVERRVEHRGCRGSRRHGRPPAPGCSRNSPVPRHAAARRARCARSAAPRPARRRAPRPARGGSAGAGGGSHRSTRARAPAVEDAEHDLELVRRRLGGVDVGEVLVVQRRCRRPAPRRARAARSGVNLMSPGPRRPKTCTSVTAEASRPASTLSGISVERRSTACLARMRATSSATLPLPITATSAASSGHSRRTSGWPSNHETKSAAPYEPGRSMPGMSSAASRMAPVARITASYRSCRSSRAMSRPTSTLPMKRMLALAPRLGEHLVERGDDALDARVVGRDAVPDEPVRGGERFEQVDRDGRRPACGDRGVREDVAGVDAGGSGADDRDAEGLEGRGGLGHSRGLSFGWSCGSRFGGYAVA